MTDPAPRVIQVMAGAANGGAETAFIDMCLAMHQAGVPQHVVLRAHAYRQAQLERAGIPYTTLPFGGPLDIYTPWRIKRLITSFRADIVQTWMSRAAQRLPRRPRKARYLVFSRLGGYYALKHFPRTDYFVTNTPDIREYLIKAGVLPVRVQHINNFAEMETTGDTAPVSRTDLATPETAPLALCLARLHTSKALDIVIAAAAQIPALHVWLAGAGPEEAALRRLAQDHKCADRIHFLGWRNDRSALLRAADMFILSSRFEPFGTSFIQAWIEGRPLIACDSDGPRQFVRDYIDGLLIPRDSVPAMVAAIRQIIDNPDLAKGLCENGLAHYQESFTKDRAVAAYLDYYTAALAAEGMAR
ncbi:MAG: glycosyltransferase [Pseudomonadota bacterium]